MTSRERLILMSELQCGISRLHTKDKYKELSYDDLIECHIDTLKNLVRWKHKPKNGEDDER